MTTLQEFANTISGETMLLIQLILVIGTAIGATISFFAKTIDDNKRLTHSGKIAAFLVLITLALQFSSSIFKFYQDEEKENKEVARIIQILNQVQDAQEKLANLEEGSEAALNDIFQLTRNSGEIYSTVGKINRQLVDHHKQTNRPQLSQDCPPIETPLPGGDQSPSEKRILTLNKIQAEKLFRDNPEELQGISVRIGEYIFDTQTQKKQFNSVGEEADLSSISIPFNQGDEISIILHTQVKRKKIFGSGYTTFKRTYLPDTINMETDNIELYFDYPGGDDVDSRYQLYYKIEEVTP